jgi:Protein of unknown function (DUF2911)
MNKPTSALVALAAMFFCATPLMAQMKRTSPHDAVYMHVAGGKVVMVVYGRPYTKDSKTGEMRKIWGGLIPYGTVWRTGADEATLLITGVPLVVGGTTIPAGAYSLWTLPNEDGSAKLIINKEIGQWGIDPHEPSDAYDEKNDLVRVDLKKDTLDKSVDQFTMSLVKDPDVKGGSLLKMAWENTQYSVPFTLQK